MPRSPRGSSGALEPMSPVVFVDALRVKMRDEGTVRSNAVYLALAILPDGSRDILGIWIEQTDGAKFWLKVFTDLKTRGCQDILIAVTDGLERDERDAGRGLPGDDAPDPRRNITATWGREANFCRSARNQFAIVYGERFTAARSVE